MLISRLCGPRRLFRLSWSAAARVGPPRRNRLGFLVVVYLACPEPGLPHLARQPSSLGPLQATLLAACACSRFIGICGIEALKSSAEVASFICEQRHSATDGWGTSIRRSSPSSTALTRGINSRGAYSAAPPQTALLTPLPHDLTIAHRQHRAAAASAADA